MTSVSRLKKILVQAAFTIFVAAGAATATAVPMGTCSTGTFEFAAVGNSCTAENGSYMAGDTDTYTFTVDSAGITGIKMEGTQTGFSGGTFQLLASDDNPVGSFTISSGGTIDALFDISALGIGTYTFTFLSLAESGSYDITLTAVPIPAAAWLFGSVLLALGIIGRKRKTGEMAEAASPA